MSASPPSSSSARRHTARAVLSLVALILAPLSWAWTIDQPFLRSSGLTAWVLIALALFLALSAARHDRRAWVRIVAGFQLAALAFSCWAFFVAARLPARDAPERAADFTLPDQDGRPVTLADELARGPVLLVFFRGHWWPSCRSELRGLGEVDSVLEQRGGQVLAISVDEVEDSKRLVESQRLPFRVLSARGIPVLADYGLEHEGGGLDGETIAVPAQLLVARDGRIVWKHVARRVTDRVAPQETLAALGKLEAQAPR